MSGAASRPQAPAARTQRAKPRRARGHRYERPADHHDHAPRGNTLTGRGHARDCSDSGSSSGRDCIDDNAVALAPAPKLREPGGAPARSNPSFSLATPGPARIGVPNFFIDKFRIPPFLLPIYQAAGMQYGVRWEILAAINEIETDYGRNLAVSSAGALGWMQFMPATWAAYGVDANRDGLKDPYNPVDAVFAAARYLRASGARQDIRRAVFAYNHADWYVDSVLLRARVIGGLPGDLVDSLTGLTQGRFPVHAKATYAGRLERGRRRTAGGNAAVVVESDARRRGIEIFARAGAPAVAVNDGRITRIGRSKRLGRYVKLQDAHGNTYTYGHLGEVARTYPAPKRRARGRGNGRAREGWTRGGRRARADERPRDLGRMGQAARPPLGVPVKERLFAHPDRPAARAAGGAAQLAARTATARAPQLGDGTGRDAPFGFDPRNFRPRPLREGVRVIGGTVLGRIGAGKPHRKPRMLFEIRPAGRGAPRIDPKPILDGWKLLESTAVYRAAGKNPFFGKDAAEPSIGRLVLMSKETLVRRVLADPRIDIYPCGREDVASGRIDRRVLITMLYLAGSGLRPTITSLECGHGTFTASGNVSEHSTGTAMDIGAINGIVISPATQGQGSITDHAIRRLLQLQGTMKPHQIISLMTFDSADNTIAMGDHDDHIHVGWTPRYGANARASRRLRAALRPKQWIDLIERLDDIDNPAVPVRPSRYAVKVVRPASRAHRGE
jgi:Transglycosylase SLT domain/Peptidase family M23